ncbi:MAG: response regulator [Candidatus Latescibacterota bacterium]|jgi:hypothetical protein
MAESTAPGNAGTPGAIQRVLLVDDDWMGQTVAAAILAEMGYEVATASSGAEAVRRWEQGDDDLILMDVQMPEMDGREATKLIRAAEAGSGRHVPIIALTADTAEADRQACLVAGMDDYLAKPIDPNAVREAIGRLAGRPTTTAEPSPRTGQDSEVTELLAQLGLEPLSEGDDGAAEIEIPAEILARLDEEFETPSGDAVLDEQAIRRLAELEERGALSLARVVTLFLDSGARIVPTLRAALAAGTATLLRREAHILKGNAWDVGAHRLAGICEELEARARDGQLEGTDDLVEQVEKAWGEAQQALQRYLQGPE